jgi:hypothetical protein
VIFQILFHVAESSHNNIQKTEKYMAEKRLEKNSLPRNYGQAALFIVKKSPTCLFPITPIDLYIIRKA